MDLKTYEKTRYQNIYRHKKNKNYIVQMSKPVKTTISRVNGEKIWVVEDALDIRNNKKIKFSKGFEVKNKYSFDDLLDKYQNHCKNDLKLSFNTLKKKRILYNLYFKKKFDKITEIKKQDMIRLIDNAKCSNKQKNELIKIIRPFFNWCVEEDIIFKSPMVGIHLYKTDSHKIKYWLPNHLSKMFEVINEDINNASLTQKYHAYLIKMVIELGLSLGDRIGETRALQFCKISKEYKTITISNSINYNTKDKSFLSPTKTVKSNDVLCVTEKLIDDIYEYKMFLENDMCYNVTEDTPILVNIKTGKPFSDSMLRKIFNKYIEKAGVPQIRMYDLRHTVATLLMSEGYDMYDIKDRLRHTSIKTTIDKYGTIIEDRRKEIAKATGKYL